MSRFFSVFISLGLMTLSLQPSLATAGGCSGSGCGGNFSATEFKDLMSDAVTALRQLRTHGPIVVEQLERTGFQGPTDVLIDPEVLKKTFTGVSVVDNTLYLDGKVVNFLSNPNSGHVDFTEKDWQENPQREKRLRMVIHELLMLASKAHPEYDDYLYNEQLSRVLESAILDEEERSVNCSSCTRKIQNDAIKQFAKQITQVTDRVNLNPNASVASPPACSSVNPYSAPIHTRCTTSKGMVYERVSRDYFGAAWKAPDGTIWSGVVGDHFTKEQDALEKCQSIGGELPSIADFARADASGLYEIFNTGETDISSTPKPGNDSSFKVFASSGQELLETTVRCIARRGK